MMMSNGGGRWTPCTSTDHWRSPRAPTSTRGSPGTTDATSDDAVTAYLSLCSLYLGFKGLVAVVCCTPCKHQIRGPKDAFLFTVRPCVALSLQILQLYYYSPLYITMDTGALHYKSQSDALLVCRRNLLPMSIMLQAVLVATPDKSLCPFFFSL